ncbi:MULTISPECIES: hypothetical protein [Bacillota]|uniref:hypothetical protein n=1 Tax=Bacillota TaxID=1239 RepID=UPI0039F09D2C
MDFQDRFGYVKNLDVKEGDKVEIIIRSPLYCSENEDPEYHSGTVSEIVFKDFKDGTYPIGIYVKFDKDSLYEDQEEELVPFSEIEDVFVKKYEVFGYGKLNEGMTLSVRGAGIGKIIWFTYRNGSLIPESISNGSISIKEPVREEDKEFIREVLKYGAAQKFSHFVLSKSNEMFGLTPDQYDLFMRVHKRHMKAMGTENQRKYAIENIKKVVWDKKEDCLKVYYDDVWWHYDKREDWY